MSRRALHASLALAGAAYVACSSTTSTNPSQDGGNTGLDGGIGPDASRGPDGSIFPAGEDAAAGGACEASTDCPSGLLCMYPLSEACSATGVCTVLAASQCAGPFCTCRGDTTAACGGYGKLPMEMPLHGPPCGATSEDGGADAGGADGSHD